MAILKTNGTGGGLITATTTWEEGIAPSSGDTLQVLVGDTLELTTGELIPGTFLDYAAIATAVWNYIPVI